METQGVVGSGVEPTTRLMSFVRKTNESKKQNVGGTEDMAESALLLYENK